MPNLIRKNQNKRRLLLKAVFFVIKKFISPEGAPGG